MAVTQYFTRRWQDGGDTQQQQQTVTATDLVFAGSSTEIAASGAETINITVDVSKLVGVYISTNVDDGCTFNPTSGTTPTFTIYNGHPGMWSEDDPMTNWLSDDFTAILVTNLDTANAATVEMRFLMTP